MLEQLGIYLIVVLIISYKITKDVFHPAVIVSGLWGTLVNMYIYTDHPLYPLSDRFCLALFLWVSPFVLITILLSFFTKVKTDNSTYYSFREELFLKLYPFSIFASIIFILSFLYYYGVNFIDIRNFLVEDAGTQPLFLKIQFYLNTFVIVYTFYALLNNNPKSKKKVLFLVIIVMLVSVFKSNKTSFLTLFVGFLFIYKFRNGKLPLKYLTIASISLVAVLAFLTVNRGDLDASAQSDSVFNFLYIYLLSPLTAFDLLLNSNAIIETGDTGTASFPFLFTFLNKLGGHFEMTELGTWVQVPLPTNVFTAMRGCYLDGGMNGIFMMSCVQGLVWGSIYSVQKSGNLTYKLFYASIAGFLFFQSFGDYLLNSFSVVLQCLFFSIILTKKIKFKQTNHANNCNLCC